MQSLIPDRRGALYGLSPAQQREHQQFLQHIARIGAATSWVAQQSNLTFRQVTRDAISELRAINAEIARSGLPVAQQQQLRAQVGAALMRHEQLLRIGSRRTHDALWQLTEEPPRRSPLEALSDEIDDALHALTGGIFRRS